MAVGESFAWTIWHIPALHKLLNSFHLKTASGRVNFYFVLVPFLFFYVDLHKYIIFILFPLFFILSTLIIQIPILLFFNSNLFTNLFHLFFEFFDADAAASLWISLFLYLIKLLKVFDMLLIFFVYHFSFCELINKVIKIYTFCQFTYLLFKFAALFQLSINHLV